MANKSTSDVILAIRQHSNTVNRKVVTDDEVLARANEGLWELYDLIDGAHGTYFVKPFAFSLTGGYGAYKTALPADFYHAKAVDKSPDTSAMSSVDPLPSFAERNNTRKRGYDLEDVGNISIYPPALAQGDYRLLYIPKCPQLASPIVVPSTNPPPPLSSPLPIPARAMTILKVTGTPGGTLTINQADMLAKNETAILSLGTWTVLRSSNGTAITSTNQWAAGQTAIAQGGWLQMVNNATGVQRLVFVSVRGSWIEVQNLISPAVGFTGGTAITAPTASDSYFVTPGVGADWLGTGNSDGNVNPQLRTLVWGSVDGTKTRVVWFYTNLAGVTTIKSVWLFDTVGGAVGGPWVPFVGMSWDNGNDLAAATRFTYAQTGSLIATRTNSNTAELIFVSQENDGIGNINDRLPQDQVTNQYVWLNGAGLTISGKAPPRNGVLGWLTDQWWVGAPAGVPAFPDGDTAGGRFIFIGQMMLWWDGSAVPGYPGSVDHPEANFYGRAAS